MKLMTIVSVALAVMLFIGFAIGFTRSWKKALVRFGIIVGCILASIILTRTLAGIVMKNYVNGLVLNIFGLSIDFEKIAIELIGDGSFVTDLLNTDSVTVKFANALINVVINLILFVVLFIALVVISYIIYLIISIIVSVKIKKEEEYKPPKIWERFIGGGVGIFGMLFICMVLFTPIFGMMSVCNEFLKTNKSNSASAYAPQTYISAGLYNTGNKSINKVEKYISEYEDLKKDYDKSFAGVVLKFTGMSYIGTVTFEKMTVVNYQGFKFDFVSECVSAINVYNQYKRTFVEKTFDISDNTCVNDARNLYDLTTKSEFMRTLIIEVVPTFSDKWAKGEKYFGISYPLKDDFEDIGFQMLNVFNTSSFTQIDENINIVFDIIEVANENEAIKDYRAGKKLENIIATSDSFVRDEILVMSKSTRFRNALPNIMLSAIELEYSKLIGNPEGKFENINIDVKTVDWEKEADIMQTVSSRMFNVYLETKNSNEIAILRKHLSEIGECIDFARESKIISEPFKIFMIDYIKSDKFKLSDSVKAELIKSIETYWNDKNYSYKDTFEALEETAVMVGNLKDLVLDNIEDALNNIISNPNMKNTLKSILESGAISSISGNDGTNTKIINELLLSFTDISSEGDSKKEVENAIKSGNVISKLVDASQSENKEYVFEGETTEEKTNNAKDMMESIAGSKVVMNVASKGDSEIASAMNELEIDKDIAKAGIESADISSEDKETLKKLFNIPLSN